MVKKTHFFIALLFTGITAFAQEQKVDYVINGKIEGFSSGKIYFAVFGPSGEQDSTEIQNGVFRFEGTLAEPSPVILSLEKNYVNQPLFMFFIDAGVHTVTLHKDNLAAGKAMGSTTTADYALLKSIEHPFDKRFQSLRTLAKDTSQAAHAQIQKTRQAIFSEREAAIEAFIRSHPTSPVAAWATHRNFVYSPTDAAKLAELYSLLSPALHYTSYALEMKAAIDNNQMLSIGKIAPNFTQNDTSGRPVSLTDFRGQYVLLDFWASWCGPCRADNPNIVKAYNAFKDKGFTVLGVSLDRPGQKEAWIKAIHQDGLTWTHVSDLQFWDNAVAKQYGIKAVPTNFLIGPDGKIIAKNLHGDALQKMLESILK